MQVDIDEVWEAIEEFVWACGGVVDTENDAGVRLRKLLRVEPRLPDGWTEVSPEELDAEAHVVAEAVGPAGERTWVHSSGQRDWLYPEGEDETTLGLVGTDLLLIRWLYWKWRTTAT